MIKEILESDLKLCLRVMKEEFLDFHLLQSSQPANTVRGRDSLFAKK